MRQFYWIIINRHSLEFVAGVSSFSNRLKDAEMFVEAEQADEFIKLAFNGSNDFLIKKIAIFVYD